MLTLPLVLGLAVVGARGFGAALPIAAAFVLAFLAHDAIVVGIQRLRARKLSPPGYLPRRFAWGAAYLAASAASFVAALILAELAARGAALSAAAPAAAAAGVYAAASALGAGRHLWSELVGMAGMALAPAMMAAAAGLPLLGRPLGAAVLAFAYSVSSVALVRAYGLSWSERPAVAAATCVGVHLVLAAALVELARRGWLPAWAIAAFVPVVGRMTWGLLRPPRNLRQLGLRELWVAGSFAILAAAAYAW
jgi:hypothetical protein